ncbi:MAG: DUF262 domain-containing protein [Gemmatimonadetes bacterium]|nr:DUF262 domain-containing protein [Gemmatimonadota bacterium]
MENGQKTIRGLFDGSKIFNIPKYQRAYAWEKEHLEDFVDDIENQKSDKDYFFGTILFQEKKEMSDDFENIDIVDGQQRITTLIIFMKLLLDQLRGNGKESEIRRLEDRYICLYDEHKLRVLQDDNDFFKSYILGDNPLSNGNVRTPSQERLRKAKNYLRQRLENYKPETLWEFKDKIERTKVLTYSVEDAAEATLIFETTNDRGKSLTNLEKTKSFLMYKTYLASDNPEDHLDTIQSRFGEIYRDYETIRTRMDENSILQYHFIAFEKWTHKSEYQDYVQALKNKVNKLVNDNRSEAKDFIDRYGRELKESFVTMRELLLNRDPHLLDIFALNRPALFYPLLIKAYKLDGAVGKQNFKRVARLVEIICFRVFGIRRRRSTTGRESLYSWTRDFNGNFEELINKLKQFVDWYCNDRAFGFYLSKPDFYNDINSNDQNYLFWKYENHLRQTEQPIFPEMSQEEFANRSPRTKFSIEHIIPQNPGESKVVEKGSAIISEIEENFLHDIGNLTIDPKSANSSKLNRPFEYKDQNYFRKAPLKTQNELSDFLNQETGQWDQGSIDQRKEKILEFAFDYWDDKKV